MVITPDQYKATSVYELLSAAAKGTVGVDHRLLRAIVERGEEAVEEAVRFGLEARETDRIELDEDLIAIFQYLGSAKALPFLIEFLRKEPIDPSEDVIHAFARIGEPAIEPLRKLYRELGPEAGADVAFVLAALRIRDPRILEVFSARAEFDPGDAAFLLGVHGDPAARPILERMLARAAVDADFATRLGNEAAEALANLGSAAEDGAPEPVSLWDLYPEHIEPVFEVLADEEKLEFLNCSSAELRADAATSFIDREMPEPIAEKLLELAAGDPNVGVRTVAATALGSVNEDERVQKLLLGIVADTAKPITERCGALLGLASRAKDTPEIKQYMEEFYKSPVTKARALEAMWRSLDPGWADYFRRHLRDSDVDVRRQAIKGIGYAGVASEAPKLTELFQDDEFRLDALFAYALSVPLAKLQRGNMPAVLRKIEDLAGGLSDAEGEAVETALDTRLMLNGMEPVFTPYDGAEPAAI